MRHRSVLVSDALMHDSHHLTAGLWLDVEGSIAGWEDSVHDYLLKNKSIMPRTAFRYALEKFDEETRARLMKNLNPLRPSWSSISTLIR